MIFTDVIGETIQMYNMCSFLGIRPIGTTSVKYVDDHQYVLNILNEELCVTIVIIHTNSLADTADIESLKLYAKSIGKVVFVYGHDKKSALLRDVNVFRSVNPTFY